ncbi:MAG: ABC transporter ATP-binding protein [Candidatus Thermoplasmatota archaeon]|nr:ABC transporter ATP-binding protein [Candidatus Thermoplasmatota archaeon]MCL5874140.1 ABC transporter ATP-binding protein [Candidatus Thermoplasmatota archaeon]
MDKLRVNGVSKRIGSEDILKNVTFSLRENEIKVILGASGSGKTSILNSIAGIISPDSGTITKDGKDITGLEIEKRNIGFVFQDLGLFYSMSVAENIAYGLRMRSKSVEEINRRVMQISRALSVSDQLQKFPSQLSGGEKQLVALARTLITEPDLILMDEPLSSLDSFLRNTMRWYIRDIQKEFGVSIIYVTHDLADAEILGDSIAILHEGSILADGEKYRILNNPTSSDVARILGYNIFKMNGISYAIHPTKVIVGGPIKARIIYDERGIRHNYLVDTDFGRIYLVTDEELVDGTGISLDKSIALKG